MSNPAPLNVFITGGLTAVAREATRLCVARGHKVTVLTAGSEGAARARQDGALPAFSDPYRAGELKSLFRMAATDVVLHCAPQSANGFPSREGYAEFDHLLTKGTPALLEAARDAGVKFIVHTSYAFLYGDVHGETVTEASAGHPVAAFRAASEAEAHMLGGSVPACVLRAGIVYSSDDAALQSVSQSIQRGRPVYLGDSHNLHNWIYAADLASAAVHAAEQQPAGQVFNVTDDQPASAADFVAYMASIIGLTVSNNATLPQFVLQRMTSAMQREVLATSARVSSAKIREALGWQPRFASYKAGLEQTLLDWRAAALPGR
jgi:nucleoside-diphosphate-sugar epimerase